MPSGSVVSAMRSISASASPELTPAAAEAGVYGVIRRSEASFGASVMQSNSATTSPVS